MSHNLLKILAGASLVGIPLFLFKDQIFNFTKSVLNMDNSATYAQDRLGASGGQSLSNNSEIF